MISIKRVSKTVKNKIYREIITKSPPKYSKKERKSFYSIYAYFSRGVYS